MIPFVQKETHTHIQDSLVYAHKILPLKSWSGSKGLLLSPVILLAQWRFCPELIFVICSSEFLIMLSPSIHDYLLPPVCRSHPSVGPWDPKQVWLVLPSEAPQDCLVVQLSSTSLPCSWDRLLFSQTGRREDGTVYEKASSCSLKGKGLCAWPPGLSVPPELALESLTSTAH